MSQLSELVSNEHTQNVEELKELLRIPSISSLSEHKEDIQKAASWIAKKLESIGMEHVEIIQTKGHPIVYADWLHQENAPTVLVYGHYDVQPVDPVHLWETPPFEPTIRDEKIYARGATDDKGQTFLHIKAVETLLKSEGTLPVNVKFCIEGEEEIGSPNLPPFLAENKEKLACDVVVISDSDMWDRGVPAITYSLRGLSALEFSLTTANSDLHSGMFGGGVQNANHLLVQLLSTLHDENGKVNVEHFYDDVVELTEFEKEQIKALDFNEDKLKQTLGLTELTGGETNDFPYSERINSRPTLEINGLWGGFQGEGTKTVIPNEAHAKITCRLVHNQDPVKIQGLIKKHLEEHAPKGCTVDVTLQDTGNPFLTPIDSPMIQKAAAAYETVYGKEPVYKREGGSIPIVSDFSHSLHAPVVLMGFGLPDENLHAPNEHFNLENFDKGILTICSFLGLLNK
ncbi:acetylornithine deacetylase/succinyl-diaminopimelate desuccinylase-like protein [Bacillus sp. SORGH_AS 510]|uniref:dipeptidase n=1 Tax=Bacillus sp. SORGH_AS_0510 TaxID=3041771 RepID=UPI00278220BB|nr:dipeptidase [Bacillus sp. SORGH_AS_0510]MDQ1146084.1 acetylornithine deacetylase/succinyl-diaminopimelate desuccinylase-like protein [Bacillus sp. SORGH_AS_0510]